MARRLAALLVVLGVCLVGVGCSSDATPREAEAADPVDHDPGDGRAGAAGADAGDSDEMEDLLRLTDQVDEAIHRLAVQCMEEAGFTVHPSREPTTSEAEVSTPVVTSPESDDAALNGYGITDRRDEDAPAAEPVDAFAQLPAEEQQRYYEAWHGQSTDTAADGRPALGGCYGEARRRVFPEDGRAPANPLVNISVSNETVNSTPEVAAVLDDWRECVAAAGYPSFADPADAYRYAEYFHYPVGERPGGVVPEGGPWPYEEARRREIDLATTDAACADRFGLREVQLRVADALLQEALAEFEPQVTGYRTAMMDALERAQALLEGS